MSENEGNDSNLTNDNERAQESNKKSKPIKVYVPIDCKNKSKKGTKYLYLWSNEYQYLSEGKGEYEASLFLSSNLKDTASDLRICSKHCSHRIRFKNGKKYEASSKLTKVAYTMTDVRVDKISIKIEDESCDDDDCMIDQFREKKSRKRKLKIKKSTNIKPKRRRKNETESESESDSDIEEDEDDDNHSTDSDEYDSSKSKKSKKRKKKKKKKIWHRFLDIVDKRFGHKINSEGVMVLAKRFFELEEIPQRIPADIEVKHRIECIPYSTNLNHNNYHQYYAQSQAQTPHHHNPPPPPISPHKHFNDNRYNAVQHRQNGYYAQQHHNDQNNVDAAQYSYQYNYQRHQRSPSNTNTFTKK